LNLPHHVQDIQFFRYALTEIFFFLVNSDPKSRWQPGNVSGSSTPSNHVVTDDDIFSKMASSKTSRKYHLGLSSSDAEIDYRRGRSLREGKGDFAWHD